MVDLIKSFLATVLAVIVFAYWLHLATKTLTLDDLATPGRHPQSNDKGF